MYEPGSVGLGETGEDLGDEMRDTIPAPVPLGRHEIGERSSEDEPEDEVRKPELVIASDVKKRHGVGVGQAGDGLELALEVLVGQPSLTHGTIRPRNLDRDASVCRAGLQRKVDRTEAAGAQLLHDVVTRIEHLADDRVPHPVPGNIRGHADPTVAAGTGVADVSDVLTAVWADRGAHAAVIS